MPVERFGFVSETIELFTFSYISLSNLHNNKIQLLLGYKKKIKDNFKRKIPEDSKSYTYVCNKWMNVDKSNYFFKVLITLKFLF